MCLECKTARDLDPVSFEELIVQEENEDPHANKWDTWWSVIRSFCVVQRGAATGGQSLPAQVIKVKGVR